MIEFRELTMNDEAAFKTYMQEWDRPEDIVPTATNFARYDNFEHMLNQLVIRASGQDWVKNTTFFYFEGRKYL